MILIASFTVNDDNVYINRLMKCDSRYIYYVIDELNDTRIPYGSGNLLVSQIKGTSYESGYI